MLNESNAGLTAAANPSAIGPLKQLPILEYEAFKHQTKYWYIEDWRKVEGQRRGRTQVNGGSPQSASTLVYLQDVEGNLPNGEAIRKDARDVFRMLVHEGNPPKSWGGDAIATQRDRFRFEMESRHEILRYCHKGWKAEATAIALYPSFKQTMRRKLERSGPLPKWLEVVKDEPIEDLVDLPSEQPPVPSRKRKGSPKVVADKGRNNKRRAPLEMDDPL